MKDAVKSDWDVRPLGEVVTLNYGKALARSERDPNGSIPVYGANGVMDWSEHTLVEGPSLVVGRKGSAGEVTRVDGPFWPSDVTYYTTHDHDVLDFDFLHYTLQTLNLPSMARGVKPGINRNDVYALPIPLPPLEEQRRIVAVLDEAFEGLARARIHAEANLQNARELFESFLDSSFSNFSGEAKERRLDDLISISHGFAFKSADFGKSTDASLPIVLTPGNYTEDACLNFTDKNTKRFTGIVPPDFLFEPGELTVVMTDLSSKMKILGKPAFIEREEILHNQRIGRIRFKSDDLHPRFLFHFLRTQVAQKFIRDTATGTMVRHTAPKRILSIVMKTPVVFSDQERILTQIDEVEVETIKLRTQYTKTVQDLDNLRQSLLQKAFAGELT